jgi:hypothetical protein
MQANNTIIIKKVFIVSLFCICEASVFYYSWLPYSNLKTESYLPLMIINWSSEYVNLRTAVPFVAIGYLIEVWIAVSIQSNTENQFFPGLKALTIAAFLVCTAEAGQFFIADRHPDFMDVFFGISGSICGSFSYLFIQKTKILFFNKNAKQT